MIGYLYKRIAKAKIKSAIGNSAEEKTQKPMYFHSSIEKNIKELREILGNSDDIIFREVSIGKNTGKRVAVVFLDGMTEDSLINESILKPLMSKDFWELNIHTLEGVREKVITASNVKSVTDMNKVVDSFFSGDTILIMDGVKEALVIQSKSLEGRAVEEPKTEVVVRGPREGFNEKISTNITLIRRIIKVPELTTEIINIGRLTKTKIAMLYIKGVANEKIVKEVRHRLKRIDTDSILESGYIEAYIEDSPFSLFATVGNSEKPDTVAAKIIEGRVAIIIEGTPFVLTVPMLFIEGFHSSEDYYTSPYYSSFMRLIRVLAFGITLLAPAGYVMLTTFHQELIPTTLLFTIAAGREGVPFPSFIEALFMVITFETLREAGVRLPRSVGNAVSIVGALVIGEAAVSAGLVGGLLVVVIAFTAICSFMVPVYTDAVAPLRIVFLIMAGALGIFGVAMGVLAMLIHMVSLRSFGVPYLEPLAPMIFSELKDGMIISFLWKMNNRPRLFSWKNFKRQENLKPNKPNNR